jgi:hypothetical protein
VRRGLVGQVQVFQRLLGVGRFDGRAQLVGQLALFLDRRQDRGAAIFHVAQVKQALFERAQLRVVQVARDFLAVAGDEWHRGAFVEQVDGSRHLAGLHGQFGRDQRHNLLQNGSRQIGHRENESVESGHCATSAMRAW